MQCWTMSLRAVFFDFGGTLVRSLDNMLPLFREAARKTRLDVPWAEFARANEQSWVELWPDAPRLLGKLPSFADQVHERALRRVGAQGPIDRMVRCIREEAVSPRWHPPFPETIRTLRELRELGLSLHVVSNNVDYLPLLLENLGWVGTFDSVTYSQELGASKPDPRLFRYALERAGCMPEDTVHVGDSWESDYLGARAVGMGAIWLNRRGRPPPVACPEIRDLTALRPLLSASR